MDLMEQVVQVISHDLGERYRTETHFFFWWGGGGGHNICIYLYSIFHSAFACNFPYQLVFIKISTNLQVNLLLHLSI